MNSDRNYSVPTSFKSKDVNTQKQNPNQKQNLYSTFTHYATRFNFSDISVKPPKLQLSEHNGPFEIESDNVGHRIIGGPYYPNSDGILDKDWKSGNHTDGMQAGIQCPRCDEEKGDEGLNKIDTKPTSGYSRGYAPTTTTSAADHLINSTLIESGHPLDPLTKKFMEQKFGYDFSKVRVYDGPKASESAQANNALAYTVGQNVVFDSGLYSPYSSVGQILLSHELTHVIQQSRGGVTPSRFVVNSLNEMEAHRVSGTMGSNDKVVVGGTSGVGIMRAPSSLEVSLNPSSLSFTELEGEIKEIQQHLDANPVSNPENDHLMEVQAAMQKEIEVVVNKRLMAKNTSGKPRLRPILVP